MACSASKLYDLLHGQSHAASSESRNVDATPSNGYRAGSVMFVNSLGVAVGTISSQRDDAGE